MRVPGESEWKTVIPGKSEKRKQNDFERHPLPPICPTPFFRVFSRLFVTVVIFTSGRFFSTKKTRDGQRLAVL